MFPLSAMKDLCFCTSGLQLPTVLVTSLVRKIDQKRNDTLYYALTFLKIKWTLKFYQSLCFVSKHPAEHYFDEIISPFCTSVFTLKKKASDDLSALLQSTLDWDTFDINHMSNYNIILNFLYGFDINSFVYVISYMYLLLGALYNENTENLINVVFAQSRII